MKKILVAGLLSSVLMVTTIGATQIKEKPLDQIPIGCEAGMARLDFAVIDTKKLEGNYLIIVARLGTGESS